MRTDIVMTHTPEASPFRSPFFIVAPPRSGTTLLFDVLAQAPGLWTIGGESHGVIESIERLHPASRGWSSNRLTAQDADSQTVGRLRAGFFARLRDRDGKPPPTGAAGLRLLEKTPRNCLRVPFLAAAFPGARFVYLQREPVETISSMLDAWRSRRFVTYPQLPGWTGPWPWSLLLVPGWRELVGKELAEVAARQWAAATSCLLDDLEALGADRWCTASYRRLVEQPQAEVVRLCGALDLPWDRMLLAPLPTTLTALTPPGEGKWRRNAAELERVLPAIGGEIERARAAGERAPSQRPVPGVQRAAPPSLFVISLPRSMSSLTYMIAHQVLALAAPAWTSDGEVLNVDRYVMNGGPLDGRGRKFTDPSAEPDVAQRLFAFLDQAVQPTGCAYKDVVQPFVVAKWLTMRDRGLAVLRIRRDLADVAYAMLGKGWLYPAGAVDEASGDDVELALLRGLLEAERALDAVPAVEVGYDDLIRDESALLEAFRALAPHRRVTSLSYVTAGFREGREARLRARETERHQLLRARLDSLRRSLVNAQPTASGEARE